jgi:hypothetical protein
MVGGVQLDMFADPDDQPQPEPEVSVPAEPTTVVDLHGHQGDPAYADVLYVGRPMYQGGWTLHGHPLANPFKIGQDGTAEEVVQRYRRWVLHRPRLAAQLRELRGRRLGCWCAEGQPCHARVLAELADQVSDR